MFIPVSNGTKIMNIDQEARELQSKIKWNTFYGSLCMYAIPKVQYKKYERAKVAYLRWFYVQSENYEYIRIELNIQFYAQTVISKMHENV